MEGHLRKCLLSFLMAFAVMSLDASNLPQLSQTQELSRSLEKCLPGTDSHHKHLDSATKSGSTSDECELLNKLRSLFLSFSNIPKTGPENDGLRKKSAQGFLSESGTDKNRDFGLYGASDNSFMYKKNSDVNSRLFGSSSEKGNDLTSHLPGASRNNNGGAVPLYSSGFLAFKPDIHAFSAMSLLRHLAELPVITSSRKVDSQGELESSSWTGEPTDDRSVAIYDKNAHRFRVPQKRSSADWLGMEKTMVSKRRRQTLSINNALMTLTDMVMEHGREKMNRNRDSLRYHMYVQG